MTAVLPELLMDLNLQDTSKSPSNDSLLPELRRISPSSGCVVGSWNINRRPYAKYFIEMYTSGISPQ